MVLPVVAVVIAYLLGSIPSAVIVSRKVAGVDIRTLGDANMGARNTARTLGWRAGLAVAVMDFSKGALAVLLGTVVGLSLGWRITAAFAAWLGHGFPIFAGFQGGQGLAVTLGVLSALAPHETAVGLAVYGLLFLATRHSDLSAGSGIALLVFFLWRRKEPAEVLIAALAMILSIPAKKWLDTPRRRRARMR